MIQTIRDPWSPRRFGLPRRLHHFRSRLAARLTVLFVAVVVAPMALVAYASYRGASDAIADLELKEVGQEAAIESSIVLTYMRDFSSDLLTLGDSPAVRAVIRAVDNGGVDPKTNESYEVALEGLTGSFVGVEQIKETFLSSVSHELRTPLTSIKGFTSLLLAGKAGSLSPQQQRYLSTVNSNSTRLGVLVDDLLDITRIESGTLKMRMGNVVLQDLASAVYDTLMRVSQSRGIGCEIEADSEPLVVVGDYEQLLRAALNIAANAFNYTPEGGNVKLRVYPFDSEAVFEVWDEGVGIAEGDIGSLFERFTRLDGAYAHNPRGAGLGLAIAKSIVELHKGEITVASKLGKGSVFCLRLPVVENERGAKESLSGSQA